MYRIAGDAAHERVVGSSRSSSCNLRFSSSGGSTITSVEAVRLWALPFFLLYWCLRVGVSRRGPAAVVGRGC